MGVRVLVAKYSHNTSCDDLAVLYSSSTDWCFGPIFYEKDGHDAYERAESFLRWLSGDARKYEDNELEKKYIEWMAQEDAQWKAEELITDIEVEG